jgi:hypothetical protein
VPRSGGPWVTGSDGLATAPCVCGWEGAQNGVVGEAREVGYVGAAAVGAGGEAERYLSKP